MSAYSQCIRCRPCAFRSEAVGVLPGLLKAVLAIQYSPVEKFKVHRCVTYAHTLLLAFCFKRASSGSTAQSLWNLFGTVSRLLQTPERCRGYLNLVYCCLREVARIKWKTTAVYIRGTAFYCILDACACGTVSRRAYAVQTCCWVRQKVKGSTCKVSHSQTGKNGSFLYLEQESAPSWRLGLLQWRSETARIDCESGRMGKRKLLRRLLVRNRQAEGSSTRRVQWSVFFQCSHTGE